MSLEDQRKRREKRKAKKAKRQMANPHFGHNPQSEEEDMRAISSLTYDEKVKIIDIVNEVGRQWKWTFPEDCMVEMPNPDHDEYTMELLHMDMAFIGRRLKDLDFDGWLFAILVEQGGTKWAVTIFSRLGKDPSGRQWIKWGLNPEFVRMFNNQ